MLQKSLLIQKGVATASSANKGLGLQAFTNFVEKHSGQTFERIIFVDDDIDNIEDLQEAYADSEQFISIVHYIEHVDAD